MEKTDENLFNLLKRATREKKYILRYSSITFLFNLLKNFGLSKSSKAPIVYKLLTFSLIENFNDDDLRELFLKNFASIFFDFPEIPISILIEPLTKQIQVNDELIFIINVYDVDFFDFCSRHSKMNLKLAIKLLDMLLKIFLNNLVMASKNKLI